MVTLNGNCDIRFGMSPRQRVEDVTATGNEPRAHVVKVSGSARYVACRDKSGCITLPLSPGKNHQCLFFVTQILFTEGLCQVTFLEKDTNYYVDRHRNSKQ